MVWWESQAKQMFPETIIHKIFATNSSFQVKLLIIMIVILLQDNTIIFLHLKSLKKTTFFPRFEIYFETQAGYIFSFLTYKTLRTIVTLFFSNFFQSSFSDGKSIPSQLYLFIKGLIFVILCGFFSISSWFNVTVTAYLKHLLSFLLMGFIVVFSFFIQSTESVYDPPRFGFILWYLWYNKWTWLETNWLH